MDPNAGTDMLFIFFSFGEHMLIIQHYTLILQPDQREYGILKLLVLCHFVACLTSGRRVPLIVCFLSAPLVVLLC